MIKVLLVCALLSLLSVPLLIIISRSLWLQEKDHSSPMVQQDAPLPDEDSKLWVPDCRFVSTSSSKLCMRKPRAMDVSTAVAVATTNAAADLTTAVAITAAATSAVAAAAAASAAVTSASRTTSLASATVLAASTTSQLSSSVTAQLTATGAVTATTAASFVASSTAVLASTTLQLSSIFAQSTASAATTDAAAAVMSETTSRMISTLIAAAESTATTSVSGTVSDASTVSLAVTSSLSISASSASISGISTSSPLHSMTPRIITNGVVINGSATTPPILLFDGGVLTVNGTLYITGGSIAQVVIDVRQQQGETRRISLVKAEKIVGSFASIAVKGETRKELRCYGYFAASADESSGTLSVLVVPKEMKCSTAGLSKRWIIGGVVMGVSGGLLIVLGLLWVFRDAAQRWARSSPAEENSLVM